MQHVIYTGCPDVTEERAQQEVTNRMQGQMRGMMREAYKKALRDHSIIRYSEAALDNLATAAFPDA